MRTPAGTECPHYYADYFRGRDRQECRLVERNPASERWNPNLCRACPVPRIVQANACRHLILEAKVVKTWLGFNRKVVVSAACAKSMQAVAVPEVGCGQCHASLDVFEQAEG